MYQGDIRGKEGQEAGGRRVQQSVRTSHPMRLPTAFNNPPHSIPTRHNHHNTPDPNRILLHNMSHEDRDAAAWCIDSDDSGDFTLQLGRGTDASD